MGLFAVVYGVVRTAALFAVVALFFGLHFPHANFAAALLVLAVAATDVLFPILPAETVLITAAVLASHGDLSIWILVPAAAIGGFLGDNVSFWLGRRIGDPVARRLFRGERARARLAWAERAIARHGPVLIVVARFLPGGRSGTTFAAGTTASSCAVPSARWYAASQSHTRSPSAKEVPGPAASTTPAPSWFGTCGSAGSVPLRDFQSVGFTPETTTRTRTSPGPGSRTGRSTRCSTSASPARS
jgi:membrane protein DedA with SNARE-associated domain